MKITSEVNEIPKPPSAKNIVPSNALGSEIIGPRVLKPISLVYDVVLAAGESHDWLCAVLRRGSLPIIVRFLFLIGGSGQGQNYLPATILA